MPCPYSIILGRDTALPWTLYHSGATGIDITGSIGIVKTDNRQQITDQKFQRWYKPPDLSVGVNLKSKI